MPQVDQKAVAAAHETSVRMPLFLRRSSAVPHFEKHFTVEEANALLPVLRGLLTELQTLRGHLVVHFEEAKPVLEAAPTNGGGRQSHAFLDDIHRLNRQVRELVDLGIELKDLERGLVDFPAWREDREV